MNRAHVPIRLPVEPDSPPERSGLNDSSLHARRKRSRSWAAVALILILTAAAAWQWRRVAARTARPGPAALRTAKVTFGALEETIRLTGVTGAEHAAALTAPQLYGSRSFGGGHSDFSLLIQELAPGGSYVNKGDQVASFDRQFMSLRLDDHRTNVKMHEAYMRVLTAQFEVRRKAQEQRIRAARGAADKAALNLKTAPVRSAIQSERFRLDFEEWQTRHNALVKEWAWFDDSERSAIRRLELDIKEQRLGLERAERNLERMVVRAPISGILVVQTIHRGGEMAEIQAGDRVYPGHLFAQVVDPKSIIVHSNVNQVDAERLRRGQRARVRFDAYPGLELPARVIAVGIFASGGGYRRDWVKSIPVRLKLEKTDPRVIPNLTVSADVTLAREEKTAIAPLECLFSDRQGGAPYVFLRDGTVWRKQAVQVGLRNNVFAAVGGSLSPGDVIAAEKPPAE